jgi:L,D-peptidoglycan transpeptidase YkuD (ErfK/YbiS/YcfS/YnhG family)
VKRACAALAVLALGCKDKPQDTLQPAPVIVVPTSELAQPPAVAVASPIPSTSRQLIIGVIEDWSSTQGSLQLFTRSDAGWQLAGKQAPMTIGRNGAAWGLGLHPQTATKQEGDGKSPAGVFRIRGAYGYADKAPKGSKLPYTRADKLECVDDSASRHYTQIIDSAIETRDWKSSENMRGNHRLYTWVIDIAHNASAVPTGGSCIFFHVWGGPDAATEGCTSLEEPALVELMKQLDPAADPIYVLMPIAEYRALHATWGLPTVDRALR